MSAPYIAIYEAGGNWRWTYRDDEADIVLHGNQDFGSAADAGAAASLAYPDIRVAAGDAAMTEADDHDRGRLFLKLLGGLLAAVGLIMLLRWVASLDDDT